MRRLKPIVLAAEDDPEFRKALELVLGRLGLNPVCVDGIDEFFANVDKLKPDLYLIDLQLGTQDGFDLIEELRGTRGILEPILVVSGGRDPEAVAHALELGANDYVMKPLDRTFLAAKLSQYLDVEQLHEHRAAYREMPQTLSSARVEFSAKVTVIDELGIHLRSASLIPKGTVLKLRYPGLADAGVPNGEALVTVVTTELEPIEKIYQAYAEFDGVDVDFMQALRRWLSK